MSEEKNKNDLTDKPQLNEQNPSCKEEVEMCYECGEEPVYYDKLCKNCYYL